MKMTRSFADKLISKLSVLFCHLDVQEVTRRASELYSMLYRASEEYEGHNKRHVHHDFSSALEDEFLDLIDSESQESLFALFICHDASGFENVLEIYRRRKEDEEWMGSLSLHTVLSKRLHRAGFFAPFNQGSAEEVSYLYQLIASDIRKFVVEQHAKRQSLKSTEFEAENKSKFATTEMKVLALDEFHKGLESQIGMPVTINILDAMRSEHDSSEDPDFKPLNPRLEWEIVIHGRNGRLLTYNNHKTREIEHDLKHYMNQYAERINVARIQEVEMAGLRLWTGPMYKRYAALLRRELADSSEGYKTTLHAINSGISKLCREWKIPLHRKVYRGYCGMSLADSFLKKDKFGCSGGVEPSVLATTEEWDTAVFYSKRPAKAGSDRTAAIIFEIEVGQVDRGADISWLSQYPHEKEILFNALSNLEVVGKPHRVFTDKGAVVVFPLRVSANLKSKTLEEFAAMRKTLHLDMVSHMARDLDRFAHEQLETKLGSTYQADVEPYPYPPGLLNCMLLNIKQHKQDLTERHYQTQNEDFNIVGNKYLALVREAAGMIPRAERLILFSIDKFPWRAIFEDQAEVSFPAWPIEDIPHLQYLGQLAQKQNWGQRAKRILVANLDASLPLLRISISGGLFGTRAIAEELVIVSTLQNTVSNLAAQFLTYFSFNTNLTMLKMKKNVLEAAGGAEVAEALSMLKGLRVLDLDDNALQFEKTMAFSLHSAAAGAAVVRSLLALTCLHTLYLGANLLGPAGCTEVARALTALTSLQKLHLKWNRLRPAGGTALAGALPALVGLQLLNLRNNALGPAGCAAVMGSLASLTGLKSLNIRNNSFTFDSEQFLSASEDEHVASLSIAAVRGLTALVGLQALNLSGNRLWPSCGEALVGALAALTGLLSLDLGANDLGLAGGAAVAGVLTAMTDLETLFLYGNTLGPDGQEVIARTLTVLKALQKIDMEDINSIADERNCSDQEKDFPDDKLPASKEDAFIGGFSQFMQNFVAEDKLQKFAPSEDRARFYRQAMDRVQMLENLQSLADHRPSLS